METNEKKIDAVNQSPANAEAKPTEQKTEDQADPNNWPVIFAYTRAEAIEDGYLVDVTETAKEAGFRYPVALTNAVYVRYVEVPEGVEGQDQSGRLWDILFMCGLKMRKTSGDRCFFELLVRNDNRRPQRVKLKAVCSGDDEGKPCITVMLPDED